MALTCGPATRLPRPQQRSTGILSSRRRTPFGDLSGARPERLNHYIEVVALNRGSGTGVLSDEQEARDWLLGS